MLGGHIESHGSSWLGRSPTSPGDPPLYPLQSRVWLEGEVTAWVQPMTEMRVLHVWPAGVPGTRGRDRRLRPLSVQLVRGAAALSHPPGAGPWDRTSPAPWLRWLLSTLWNTLSARSLGMEEPGELPLSEPKLPPSETRQEGFGAWCTRWCVATRTLP